MTKDQIAGIIVKYNVPPAGSTTQFTAVLLAAAAWAALLPAVTTAEDSGFAVVELFTSEGCSSCPPADAVLRQLAVQAEKENQPVYVLSFHVDYWNQLGWKDPFSSAEFSKRQRLYAGVHGKGRVYTPQMIVNGNSEFVGSNKQLATSHVKRGLSKSNSQKLTLSVATSPNGQISATASLNETSDGLLMNFAVVQDHATISVLRGENADRSLSHRNIVRNFQVRRITDQATQTTLAVPKDIATEQLSVIAYVQVSKTGRILAADRAAVPNQAEDNSP